jgi:hypothetical protein
VGCCEDDLSAGLLGLWEDLEGFGRRGRETTGLVFDVDRSLDTAGSSRMEGARWRGGVIGRWMEGSDAGSGAFGGWDRAANAFACFAFDTARANGAGIGVVC